MWRYTALRFVDAVPTVLLVLTLVFVAMRLLPAPDVPRRRRLVNQPDVWRGSPEGVIWYWY